MTSTINSLHINNKETYNNNNNIELGNIYEENDVVRITESNHSMLLYVSDIVPLAKSNLLYNLQKYDKVISFIKISAILSVKSKLISINDFKFLTIKDKFIKIFDISYSVLAWFIMILSAVLIIPISMTDLSSKSIVYDTKNIILKLVYYASLLFRFLLIIISRILLDKRFHSEVKTYEIPFYHQNIHISQIYIFIGIFSCLPFILQNVVDAQLNFILLKIFSTYYIILSQSIIILFIIVDNRIASTIMNDLLKVAYDNTITMEQVIWVKEEIDTRVNSSKNLTNLLVIVCIFNTGMIIYLNLYYIYIINFYKL